MKILGIETSCDECSVAVVENGTTILSNIVATQIEQHRQFQGVVPEIASRLHVEWIQAVTETALEKAEITNKELDGIAVTNRPGLLGSLLVGVNFAKAYSAALNLPIVAVDHIRAHLYASQIGSPLQYPYIGLLVSGGHTIICIVHSYDDIEVLGTTIDDAVGEAFDKVAKHYNFGYPGGVAIDRLAQKGDSKVFMFPGSTLQKGQHKYDVSYSGLKSATINQLDLFWNGVDEKSPENIAASFQRAAVNMLIKRVRAALEETGLKRLSAGGGVAANSYLRLELEALKKGGYEVSFPSLKLCTDNGAMIAALAYRYLADGIQGDYSESASARVTAFKKQYS